MPSELVEKAMVALTFIENFTYNHLVSNIAVGQEFGQISNDRQRVKE